MSLLATRLEAAACATRTRTTWLVLTSVAGAMLGAPPAVAAPKTDVVVLENGDRVTGEIKGLEHNRLRLSTDHMGTIYIEWDKIARLSSKAPAASSPPMRPWRHFTGRAGAMT